MHPASHVIASKTLQQKILKWKANPARAYPGSLKRIVERTVSSCGNKCFVLRPTAVMAGWPAVRPPVRHEGVLWGCMYVHPGCGIGIELTAVREHTFALHVFIDKKTLCFHRWIARLSILFNTVRLRRGSAGSYSLSTCCGVGSRCFAVTEPGMDVYAP